MPASLGRIVLLHHLVIICLLSLLVSRNTLRAGKTSRVSRYTKRHHGRFAFSRMSLKAKDLTYNKEQPAFLQRLRAQHGGDRSNVQFARPKKDRLKTGDADEDEPTIVDEHGETVAKAEWEARLKTEHEDGEKAGTAAVNPSDDVRGNKTADTAEAVMEKQQLAGNGAGKKRKAAKVVTDEDFDTKDGTAKAATVNGEERTSAHAETIQRPASKPKRKGKKIKLSFDEPD